MNPSRFSNQSMQSSESQQQKDSRRFWIVTLTVAVLLAVVALAFFFRP